MLPWQQVSQLCNCAAVLTQSFTSIPESDQQYAMHRHSTIHSHRLLGRCRLACHPKCTAAMQASSKSFLAAVCKGTSQNSLGPCCPHTCHEDREVFRPYRAHAFDWTLVRAPHLLDAFCWTWGILNLHLKACRTTIQFMQAPSANLAKSTTNE